jgi:uncharacterized protein (DUF1330 family)
LKKALPILLALSGVTLSLGSLPVLAQTSSAARSAYVVAEFQLTDPERIKPYREQAASTLKPYGGRFIARGGGVETKEGSEVTGRIILIKFDSMAQAKAWYHSPAYQAIAPIRQRSGNTRVYIVEGLDEN